MQWDINQDHMQYLVNHGHFVLNHQVVYVKMELKQVLMNRINTDKDI